MNLIVAVDENWGIGKDNQLLCRISADLKRFRAITTGHVLVLGRKTLESFPNGKPLPNRTHMVLTANKAYPAEGVTLCRGLWRRTGRKKFLSSAVAVCIASSCQNAKKRILPKFMIRSRQIRSFRIWIRMLLGH